MIKISRRYISILLAAAMAFSALPMSGFAVYAEEEQGQTDISQYEGLDAANEPAPIDEPTEEAVAMVEKESVDPVYVTSLANAFATENSGATVTLLQDVNMSRSETHYAYFDVNGNPIANILTETTLTVPVTVRECTHNDVKATSNNNGTHSLNCPYCGYTETTEPHTLGADNKCEGCQTQLVAKVEKGDGTTIYLDESDFAKAFDNYNYDNVTVTLSKVFSNIGLEDKFCSSPELTDTEISSVSEFSVFVLYEQLHKMIVNIIKHISLIFIKCSPYCILYFSFT